MFKHLVQDCQGNTSSSPWLSKSYFSELFVSSVTGLPGRKTSHVNADIASTKMPKEVLKAMGLIP